MMQKLDKKDFEPWGRWVAPTLAWELGYRWTEGKVTSELVPNLTSTILVLDGYSFFRAESQKQANEELGKHIEPIDKEYFTKFVTLSDQTIENFMQLMLQVEAGSSSWKDLLKDFFNRYEELWSPWMASFVFGHFIEHTIKKLVKKYNLSEEDVLSDAFSKRKNFSAHAKEEIEEIRTFARTNNLLLSLASKDIKLIRSTNNQLAEKIEAFVKKNKWIGTHHFWGNPYTIETFFEEVSNIKPAVLDSKKTSFPDDLSFFLELAGYCSWLRLQCAEASDIVAYAFRPILDKAADAMHISYDDLIWLSHEEILKGIDGQGIVPMATINERKRAVGAMLAPEKVEIFEGQKLKELLDIFIEKQDTNITEFKGAPATRGYAKGRVRVIFVPHLVTDFKKGDILVAPETTPDFVSHMKSAAAIITDQGGITSHAAIISREMKIPCIVGTKIATQVLKDGDLVEVDAEKGIVRILEGE